MIKKGLVLVNGEIATTATFINGNEVITLKEIVEVALKKRLILDLDVVYEDDYLAIINKPAGILVSGNTFKTVANGLSQNLKESNHPDAVKPQPVHRLDYPTTGLLLVGKTSASILALNKLFENKKIAKTYMAITIGKMGEKGRIEFSIDEKEAESMYEVVQTVTSQRFQYLNLVKLIPETGRRHQLRKHLSGIGNPILGDKDYGKEPFLLKGKGLYLHAYALEFTHPYTKESVHIKTALPKKFASIFETV